jgi:hypothetical protein
MAKPNGRYRRLETLQTLDQDQDRTKILQNKQDLAQKAEDSKEGEEVEKTVVEISDEDEEKKKKAQAKENEKRAKDLAKDERGLFLLGSIGAILQGLIFPGQGFVFAFMIEVCIFLNCFFACSKKTLIHYFSFHSYSCLRFFIGTLCHATTTALFRSSIPHAKLIGMQQAKK